MSDDRMVELMKVLASTIGFLSNAEKIAAPAFVG
jgi:hypothetical protein